MNLNTPIKRLFYLFTLSLPGTVMAENTAPSLSSSLLKTSLTLVLIIGVILALAWLLRKSQAISLTRGRNIQLIETLPLGRNERLCLVKSGDKHLLLGVTAQGISRLDELPEDACTSEDDSPAWNWAQGIFKQAQNTQSTTKLSNPNTTKA